MAMRIFFMRGEGVIWDFSPRREPLPVGYIRSGSHCHGQGPSGIIPLVKASLLAAAFLAFWAAEGHAQKSTVCSITVNSADEGDAFRKYLPEDRYEFVELVERGRPDWLASACHKGVQGDVLVVSRHFPGTEFYSSKFDVSQSLPLPRTHRPHSTTSSPRPLP